MSSENRAAAALAWQRGWTIVVGDIPAAAARVVHKVGSQYDRKNYLLMFAMGPNVAGVIGTVIAAGIFLTLLG